MDREVNIFERDVVAFNTPLEIGLRALFVLNAIDPMAIDLNRMVYIRTIRQCISIRKVILADHRFGSYAQPVYIAKTFRSFYFQM